MTRPDLATLEALGSLQGNSNWERVKAWLIASANASDADCRTVSDEVALRQAQGRSQTLHELLDLADTANSKVKAARSRS